MAVGGKVSGVYYLRVFQYALWSNPQRYQFLQPKYNFESEFIDSWMLQLHTLEQGPNKALSVEVATLLEKNLDRVEFQELLFLIESIGRMKNVDFISLDKIKTLTFSRSSSTSPSASTFSFSGFSLLLFCSPA